MDLEDKIIDLLANELDSPLKEEVEQLTQTDNDAKKLLEDHLAIREDIQHDALESPDEQWVKEMKHRLSQQTGEAKIVQSYFSQNLFKKIAVAAAILMLGGLGYMNIQQRELIEKVDDDLLALRTEMQESLTEPSVSTRIKAVNFSNQVEDRDEIIINLLIETMMMDRSAHVRLAAVESLRRWLNEERVQASMTQAIGVEEDPSVQILLIEILTSLNDKKIAPYLDDLINDDNVPGFIKEEAHKGKFNLEIY